MQGGAAIVLPPRLAGSRGLDLDGAQPVRGADSLSARFAAARTPALRSRGNTAATRENAISAAIANPCRGRCSHCARRRVSEANRTAGPALRPEIVPGCSRRRGVREGHAPPLHAVRERPAKWDCRIRPGERRAGCPHPAAPRGRAVFRGRDKSRPYGQILCSRQTGRHDVCPGLQGRATALPQGAAAGQAGPIWNRPLHGVFTAVGMFPILNRQGAAGVNARPTEPGKHGDQPGKFNPRGHCKPM